MENILNIKQIKIVEYCLSIAVFGLFIGHGLIALGVKPAWIPLITAFGISKPTAILLLPLIGTMDIFVAFMALFKPFRIILIWAIFWAFMTALSRPISGEPILEFIERTPNFVTPMVLLVIHEFSRKSKATLKNKINDSSMFPSSVIQ